MAAKNERVMDMVRREIQKNPSVPSQELFDKAKKMDSSIGRLDIRQFHASYPLQVKRLLKTSGRARAAATPARRRPGRPRKTEVAAKATKKAPAAAPARRRRRTRTAKAATGATAATAATAAAARGERDTVRSILIKFAGEVAAADQKADVVQVIGSMDRYVDQVMRAASSA